MARFVGGFLGEGLSGRVGNAVLVRTAGGTVLRERPVVVDPQSPAQRAVRDAQARAARAWSDLEPEAVERWAAYAKAVGLRPMCAFTNLYKALLRLSPATPVPLFPPERPFFGDLVTVIVGPSTPPHPPEEEPQTTLNDASLRSSSRRTLLPKGRESLDCGQAEGGTTPTLPSPEGEEFSIVTFSASAPNAAGIVTELLLQPLASRNRRTYREKYRHAAYTGFAGGLTKAAPCEAGWVACAYRFVNAVTGQVTEIAELGLVRVG